MARDIDLGPTPAGMVGKIRRRARPEKMAIKRNPPEVRADSRTTDPAGWWVGIRSGPYPGDSLTGPPRPSFLWRTAWSVGIVRDGVFLHYRSRRDPSRAVGAAVLLAMMLGRPCLYVMPGDGDYHYRTEGAGDDLLLSMEGDDGWVDMRVMDAFVSAEACPADGAVRLVLTDGMRWHQTSIEQVEVAVRELLGTHDDAEV